MGPPGKPRGSGEKAAWLCKSCVNGKGEPFRNSGAHSHCAKCKYHKGFAFGQVVPGPPSRRVGGSGAADIAPWLLAAKLREQKQQLEQKHKLELERLRGAASPDAAAAEAPAPPPQAADRKRIAILVSAIKSWEAIGDSDEGATKRVEAWKVELEQLRLKEKDSLPLDKRYAAANREAIRL